MATQCSLSSSAGSCRLATLALATLLLTAVGCRTTTTTLYLPTAERERLTLAEGGETLRQFLELGCPATAEGDTVVARVRVSDEGAVEESELEGSSGSATLDGIIGAISAQLTFAGEEPRPPAGQARVRVLYSCGQSLSAALELVDS